MFAAWQKLVHHDAAFCPDPAAILHQQTRLRDQIHGKSCKQYCMTYRRTCPLRPQSIVASTTYVVSLCLSSRMCIREAYPIILVAGHEKGCHDCGIDCRLDFDVVLGPGTFPPWRPEVALFSEKFSKCAVSVIVRDICSFATGPRQHISIGSAPSRISTDGTLPVVSREARKRRIQLREQLEDLLLLERG